MTLIEWDEAMSVGVEELDAQHKTLIDLINQTYEAIERQDESQLPRLVDEMAAYGETHFASEERFMRETGFADLEAHKFHHAKFRSTVDDFRRSLESRTDLTRIFVFLSRWLAAHIMDEDKRYAPRARGL